MTVLLEALARTSIVLIVAFLAVRLLEYRSAALRHAVMAGALLSAGVVVPLSWWMPAWTVDVPRIPLSASHDGPITSGVLVESTVDTLPATGSSMVVGSAAAVTGVIWLIGFAACTLEGLVSMARLRRLAARAVPVRHPDWTDIACDVARAAGVRRSVVLLETSAPSLLATWGVLRPRILVPAHALEWDRARIGSVLRHEMAHIQRHDWLVQTAADAVRAMHWFNPLVWLACRRLRVESERACDDAVLRGGVSAQTYARHLVEVARACRPSSVPRAAVAPMAVGQALHRRVIAMLSSRTVHTAVSTRSLAWVAVAFACAALPVAALRAAAAAPEGPRDLTGIVYDPSGAVLPGAALSLEDDRHAARQATSDADGRFEFAAVAPGRYVLGVGAVGFRKLVQPIELRREGDWSRAVILQVGAVQETITIRSARPTAPPPQAAVPVRVRVGGNIRPPRKLKDALPVYPESMRAAGVEGVVPLEAIIGRDGTVRSARVIAAVVHPDFAQAAIDAVRQWRFDPTLLNGTPVEVVMNVTMTFELEG